MNPLAVMARRSMSRFQANAGDFTFGEWLNLWSIDGPMFIGSSSLRGDEELPPATLEFLSSIYGRSSVVFAALQVRWKLFAQARYQFQQMFGGRQGGLFGTPDLLPLEHPEPGETTLDLNFRAIQYADLAGDWFGVLRPANLVRQRAPGMPFNDVDRIKPLRPDWTVIVLGSRRKTDAIELAQDPDAEIIGFGYTPGGPASGKAVIAYGREEVAHFHPNTGPLSRYRGMPLIFAALPEILADNGATGYKRAFMRNAATPNLAVTFPPGWDEDKAKSWVQQFEKKHAGRANAFKTMYMSAGMTIDRVGSSFKDMAYTDLAGTMETRVAAVIGMHPVIIPFSEGLAGSAMNAGNYGSAKRSTSDITLRYLWPNMCGSLETIVPPPPGTRLWYDQRSVPFLQADVTDQANVSQIRGTTIGSYIKDGFTPASAVDAVISGDESRLVHTGLVSVQLQPPGATLPSSGTAGRAERVNVNPSQLRSLLDAGWTPAGPADAEIVRGALIAATVPSFRASRRFWPADGPISGEILEGTVLASDHALVMSYPSLFEPEAAVTVSIDSPAKRLAAGPAPIVTKAEVLAKRAELEAAGRDAGYDSLARQLFVSPTTIRRRLGVQ